MWHSGTGHAASELAAFLPLGSAPGYGLARRCRQDPYGAGMNPVPGVPPAFWMRWVRHLQERRPATAGTRVLPDSKLMRAPQPTLCKDDGVS